MKLHLSTENSVYQSFYNPSQSVAPHSRLEPSRDQRRSCQGRRSWANSWKHGSPNGSSLRRGGATRRRPIRGSSSSSIILRRWVIGHLLMTQPSLPTHLHTPLTSGTRKRPPHSGFVQVGFEEIGIDLLQARLWITDKPRHSLDYPTVSRGFWCDEPASTASFVDSFMPPP
jgi:hypothetical protein